MHQPYASLLVAGIKKYIFVDMLQQLLITAICLGMKVVLGTLLTEVDCGSPRLLKSHLMTR